MSGLGVRHEGGVLVLTLDRPERANAIDEALNDALVEQLERAAREEGVRAVLLAAAGTKCFCAGADLKEFAGLDPAVAAAQRRGPLVRMLEAFVDFPKPLVAAVQAQALGAGLMLAALADEVVAADSALFGMPEIRHGMPSPIGMAILAVRTGARAAERLVQLGEPVDAAQASRLGLVDEVTTSERLPARALERARALGGLAPRAFAVNKAFTARRLRSELEAARRLVDAA
jgi:enoyl-CoA hydratase/carnithine racemase